MKFKIRLTTPNDYAEICDLENNYEYHEEKKFFINKVKAYPEGCFVADVDGIIGHIISFPYLIGKSFPSEQLFEPISKPSCWYIHNLYVSKDFRKKGIAKELTEIILNSNKIIALTATQGSEYFWEKLGFRSFFELIYCGEKAQYMILIK